MTLAYEESTDVAAAANALEQVDLPATVAGLGTRDGRTRARSASTDGARRP